MLAICSGLEGDSGGQCRSVNDSAQQLLAGGALSGWLGIQQLHRDVIDCD